jgi:tripartite-type tricarboxylate transporter receptor subunit TctC
VDATQACGALDPRKDEESRVSLTPRDVDAQIDLDRQFFSPYIAIRPRTAKCLRANNGETMPHSKQIWFATTCEAAIRALALALIASLGLTVAAQDYPTRPVHLVVPIPPGGPTDAVARVLAEKLGEVWKQPVIVDNKPGAQSVIGTEQVSRASPDGYTVLMLVDSTVTMLPFRKQKVPYDPKSLTPVMTLTDTPMLLVASESTKAESLADIVRMAKARPGQVSVAIGTFVGQAFTAQFSTQANIRLLPVPYKGGNELTTALLGGDVDVAVTSFVSVQPHVGTGRVRILATTGVARNPAMPTVPTLKELGYPGFEGGVWVGLAVPAGTPDRIVQKLYKDASKVMEMPDVSARITGMGSNPFPGGPSSTAELIRVQSKKWSKVVPSLD